MLKTHGLSVVKVALAGAFVSMVGTSAAWSQSATPSSNATINLIRLLVKQGVISQKNADALVKEAEQEAELARAQQTASAAPAGTPAAERELPPPAPGVLRVPYVPEVVKNQIRDEVKKEVLAQARDENWAQPQAIPAWTKRIKLHGDFRFRDEADLYSKNNADDIIDFASFNANGPTDVGSANPLGIPFLNTREDRYDRLSYRARLGVDAVVADGVLVGLSLASGGDSGPVSTTQLLGGGFGKKDIWLDQAFITLEPLRNLAFTAGRMPNPFFHTDLVWDPDLNFDGVAAAGQTKTPLSHGFGLFSSAGFFPVGYIGTNFPNNCGPLANVGCRKSSDYQKWLLGGQIGLDWGSGDFDWRAALSAYDFHDLQGSLSTPCFIYLGYKECSTDQSRPAFMQKGNTLFLIRQIVPQPGAPVTSIPEFVGYSMKFDLVNATQQFSYNIGGSDFITFGLDYVRNLAYSPKFACRYAPLGGPLTNVLPGPGGGTNVCDPSDKATLQSGPNGYYANLAIGDPVPRTPWAWNISLGYKYLEPDAVPDAFTDSDFHLGGTNARGFIVGASVGLFQNTWLTARYLSANEVSGPPIAIDVVQLDLNAGF